MATKTKVAAAVSEAGRARMVQFIGQCIAVGGAVLTITLVP